MLGYNGVLHEAPGYWQVLGNGYRVYNPVLMRFHSPDDMSPFGKGGLNAYSYCLLDPINQVDPSGHWSLNAFAANLFGFRLRTPLVTPVLVASAASLAAVGLAVASQNETQRGFAIAGAVILAAASLKGGHHAWVKRKLPAPTGQSAGTSVATPTATPITASAPPMTPVTPAAPSPLSTPIALGSPAASTRASASHSSPNVASHRATPQRRVLNRADLPPPPPPPSMKAVRLVRDLHAASPHVRSADIRKGSAQWEEAAEMRYI